MPVRSFIPAAEIHTARLILKGVTPAIVHEIYNTRSKDEIMQIFGFAEGGYQHFKAMHEGGMETHRLSIFFFLMIEKDSNLPIGDCGFHTWNRTHRRAEMFYNIVNDLNKKKGYMSEAIVPVLKHGFEILNLHRVEALAAAENIPSIKLLQKNGFTWEGTMREDYIVDGRPDNSECYSLLKWEWEKNKS